MRKTLIISAAIVGLCGVALAQTDPTCSMYNGMAQGNAPGTRCGGSGPRQDRVRFREALRWPDDLGYVCLRFIEVPAEIHRTLPNADRIPIFEYIAKNYYKRLDITIEEDIVASERQQRGIDSPLVRPGRFSHREPLVHEIDNWILDRVLDA